MHKIAAQAVDMPAEDEHFHAFLNNHRRVYASVDEYHRRRAIFQENLAYINAHNARKDVAHKLGVTRFADMTHDEILNVMVPNRFKSAEEKRRVKESFTYTAEHKNSGQALPAAVDWVAKGKVNPPKDQGACGSCWTFGTAGSLEGAYAIKTGNLVSLSEQQILDCAWVAGGDSGTLLVLLPPVPLS
jgi:C1A family cysteine protease